MYNLVTFIINPLSGNNGISEISIKKDNETKRQDSFIKNSKIALT